ncbi:MAG: alpha-isopropylmalate synthase regulatory domain-containing protein, partial [Candidatus Puniceispirillaceae bacterium]
SGTAAVTRVLIEFTDSTSERWRTVGVSTNIIDASVIALAEGLRWRLLKDSQSEHMGV